LNNSGLPSNHEYVKNAYIEGYVDNGYRKPVHVGPPAVFPTPPLPTPVITSDSVLTEQPIIALTTVNVGDLVSNSSFINVPLPQGDVILTVNGVDLTPANGSSDIPNTAFYITDSTGAIVRTAGNYQVGDLFHWNGATAGFQLEAGIDKLILIYEIAI
jgi:hypothetical protein